MPRLSRRSILFSTTLSPFSTALSHSLAAKRRPNIVLMIGDNWAAPHASAYDDPVVRTPVFDRIAHEGVLFHKAFAPTPSCSPSRSSLLTGQETHRLRDGANLYGNLDPQFPTYTEILERAGYSVAFSGKGWAPGSVEKSGRKRNPAGHAVRDLAALLRDRSAGQPFCYWFGSTNPHVPWTEGADVRASLDLQRIRVPAHLPDRPEVREDIRSYYAEVQAFDRQCGAIVDQLRASGEIDNTILVMTSDNGWQMPRGLANCYDLGVRIPMAIRWPAAFKAGRTRDDFVSIADLMPTFLEAAGLKMPAEVTAKSLLDRSRRDHLFLERERHANVRRGDLTYPVRGIRTRDFLYLRNLEPDRWPAGDPEYYWAVGPYGDIDNSATKRLLMAEKPAPFFDLCMSKRPAEELYDLRSDPDQVRNIATLPAYAAQKRSLAKRVTDWMKSTADPRAAGRTDVFDRVPYIGPKREQ